MAQGRKGNFKVWSDLFGGPDFRMRTEKLNGKLILIKALKITLRPCALASLR
jgi:hypothetical protein